jgi:outer membrane lipoprotein-sorting protein
MRPLPSFIILITILFTFSCSTFRSVDHASVESESDHAGKVLALLKNQNNTPQTFKGIGKLRIVNRGKSISTRIAWIGSKPKKIFIQSLNPLGQPLETFSYNGKHIYFLSSIMKNRFYKRRTSNPNLEKIISIPIKSGDVLSFLAGSVPLYKHKTAILEKEQSHEGYVLILRKKRRKIVEKIYFNNSKTEVLKVELFDSSGILVYRMIFDKMQNINGYSVPLKLTISNDDHLTITLDIDRYWADVLVDSSVFVLSDPKDN